MSRKLLVLFAVLMLIVPFASVNAQTVNEGIDYCSIMDSDEDCQILVNNTEAMKDISSFAFDMAMTYDISMEGEAAQGMDNMNFGITGGGMLAIDTEAFATIQDLAMTDMEAYMAQMPTLLDQMFSGIEGEAYILVSLPEMLAPMVGTNEIPLNVLAKDGTFAIDVLSLEEALGEDPSGLEWAGINLNGAFETMMEDFDMSSFYTDEQMESMMQFDTEALAEAMTITRLDDSDVNGVSVAVFELMIDYGVMLDSMGLGDMLSDIYTDSGMSPAEIEGVMSMLEDINIVVNQYVGLEDFYTHRVEVTMDFAIDGEMMGEDAMDSMGFGFDMWFEMSEFNTPVDIQLPEDAMIMPFEMLMGGGA